MLVSLGFGCVALAHFASRPQRRHSVGIAVLSLIVIAVLLFPVISVTDDLNPMLFASEDATRRMTAGHAVAAPAVAVILLLGCLLVLFGLVKLGTVHSDHPIALAIEGFTRALRGRAPPVLA